MMKNKKLILAVVALAVAAAVMMGVYTMTRPETVKGAKEYAVTVIHSEGDKKVFLLDTDAEYNTVSIEVKAGDELQFSAGTLPNEENEYPAATLTFTVSFEETQGGNTGT